MKFFIGPLMCFLLIFSVPSFAEYQWGFGNLSLNYLDWNKTTEAKSVKRDFAYLELEGGGQFNWGEIYGFFDLENFVKDGDKVRTASKGTLRYYLGQTHFNIYAHVYNFDMAGFSEQNRILGFGYNLGGDGWWFKPFLGVHQVSQTYFNGMNGYMAGWILGYAFKMKDQSFLVTNWHEIEFARKDTYTTANGNKSHSFNGALGLWWNLDPIVTLGLQWRYAVDKLGTAGEMNAGIASVKYNF